MYIPEQSDRLKSDADIIIDTKPHYQLYLSVPERHMRHVIEILFTRRPEKTIVQLFRYTFVSAASLAVDFLLLALLTEIFSIHYLLSAAFSYLGGLIVNYFLSIVWVFHSRKLDNRRLEFGIFLIIGIAGLGINELLMWLFVDVLALYYLLARVFSAGFGYAWKYVARKLILFS